jgi:hypothetical protein
MGVRVRRDAPAAAVVAPTTGGRVAGMAEEPAAATPPDCPVHGIAMRPTTRVMRSHGLEGGQAIPHDKTVNVWRCPACGRELPRSD